MQKSLFSLLLPGLMAVLGIAALVYWVGTGPIPQLQARVPGLDKAPAPGPAKIAKRPVLGQPVYGQGKPSALAGAWPCFRGAQHDALCKDEIPLARQWPEGGPEKLWTVELGDGYAAAAISAGRVYVLDHVHDATDDIDRSADVMRCLSLDDGREIWHNGYPVIVPWSHGRSRTIPAIAGKYVVSIGPQCQAAGWDAETGKGLWLMDMVLDYGAVVPPWYTGQCPLIDEKTDRLILAPGGKALLIAVDYKTGKVVWDSPNPHNWAMTHASVVPMEFAGRRMYVYCGKGGVAGVAADTGEILWETDQWQIGTATCPSPVVVGEGKIFFSGGYNTGALMLQLRENKGKFRSETLFRLAAKQFSSEQQTPVLFNGFLYGVRQHDKKLVCLDLNGKEIWNSGREKFGSAPYMIADGLIFIISDDGLLATVEATTAGYKPLARAQVIENGYESWGPMAMAAGRLIVRDMTRMVCLKVSEK
ncbi:MAG: PQQ-binding-like beta-propeller repeat protein [Thermoguttaceae bacterium]|jgi:outer membrane protein assembly factor BamB